MVNFPGNNLENELFTITDIDSDLAWNTSMVQTNATVLKLKLMVDKVSRYMIDVLEYNYEKGGMEWFYTF